MNVEQVAWIRRVARDGRARDIRESAGITASEVARILGVPPSTVCRWERGERVPREQYAERWAELLRRMSA
jgi:transcriptional regulator with XRE-family HTH domain